VPITKVSKIRMYKTALVGFMYAYWLICSHVFLHFHVLPSGEVIEHRHFYPIGKKGAEHHHGENEIRTFSTNYLFEFFDTTIQFKLDRIPILWYSSWEEFIDFMGSMSTPFSFSTRGPPNM